MPIGIWVVDCPFDGRRSAFLGEGRWVEREGQRLEFATEDKAREETRMLRHSVYDAARKMGVRHRSKWIFFTFPITDHCDDGC